MALSTLNLSRTLRTDPTRTTTLRARYMAEMKRRFADVRRAAVKAIVELDVFGLKDSKPFTFHQGLPERQAYRFMTKPGKVEAFNKWFQGQVDSKILTTTVKGDAWTSKYVHSAYKQGSLRAYMDSHPEAMGEKLDFYRGRREQFLESAFNRPERLEKLRLLYARSFEDLKGISAAMSQQVGRVLADGISHGLNPVTIARTLAKQVNNISNTRAMTMARTEVIHVHSEGQLDSFDELGVKEIGVMAEWSTAGDDLVCPLCEALEGVVMTVAEARGLIPRHPNCRCAWIPANVGEKEKEKRYWTALDKKKRVHKSLMAGLPKRTRGGVKVPQTVREAKRRSTWAGKDLKPVKPPADVDLARTPKIKPKPLKAPPKVKKKTVAKPKPTEVRATRIEDPKNPQHAGKMPVLVEDVSKVPERYRGRFKEFSAHVEVKDGRVIVYPPTHSTMARWTPYTDPHFFRKVDQAFAPYGDDVFVRVHNKRVDYEFLKKGTHRGSMNHATGEYEGGLSVATSPEYAAKHGYLVRGKVIGQGTDGEPLLDVLTAKPASELMSFKKLQTKFALDQEKKIRALGFTTDEFRALKASPMYLPKADYVKLAKEQLTKPVPKPILKPKPKAPPKAPPKPLAEIQAAGREKEIAASKKWMEEHAADVNQTLGEWSQNDYMGIRAAQRGVVPKGVSKEEWLKERIQWKGGVKTTLTEKGICEAKVARLEDIYAKAPKVHQPLFRGMRIKPARLKRMLKGEVFSEEAFSSYSLDRTTAEKFATKTGAKGRTRVLLKVRNGEGVDITQATVYKDEMEVLVHKDKRMKVVRSTEREMESWKTGRSVKVMELEVEFVE